MIGSIFSTLSTIVQEFAQMLVSMFGAVVGIFYTAPSGSDTVGQLTVVGTLTLIALGSALVIWGMKFIRGLIRLRTR